jgi:hypothetical protein
MTEITINTREGVSITVNYAIGETIQENIDLHGADTITKVLKDALTLRVQNRVRALINAEKSEPEIHADLAKWQLGSKTRRSKIPVKDKVKTLMDQMSPEERAAVLKEMQAQLRQQKAA